MAICPHCGNNVSDGASFCTNCGASLAPQPAAAVPAAAPVTFQQTPPYINPAQSAASSKSTEPVSFGVYLGLLFLFSLPIAGFICCIIFSCTAHNKNVKNFSIGYLVFCLILFVVSAVLTVGFIHLFTYVFTFYPDWYYDDWYDDWYGDDWYDDGWYDDFGLPDNNPSDLAFRTAVHP